MLQPGRPETTAEADARDAARYRWLRANHFTGERFVARITDPRPRGGTVTFGVRTEAEFDRAVDEHMDGETPATVKVA